MLLEIQKIRWFLQPGESVQIEVKFLQSFAESSNILLKNIRRI